MYERVADLPVAVSEYDFERYDADTTSGFTRVSTVVRLAGDGCVGRGEDVTYDAADHDALHASPPSLPTGTFTFAEFSAALDETSLFPEPPQRPASRHYRRWAVESAALELALRQADADLGSVLGRSYDPVRFVVSTRLDGGGDAPSADRLHRLLDDDPTLEFKLDPTPAWDETLVDALAATDSVRVLDFKAHYDDPEIGQKPDADRYRLVADAFPDAILEDAALTDETRPVLEPEADRLSWDKPIEGLADVRTLPIAPRWLNVKPSRFGTVESLLETVEWALENDVSLYGGGQFELDVGRQHVQALASLFYPDAPNDVAPRGYNDPRSRTDLPSSPLDPTVASGFGRR